jgi:hypothetical protein
LEGQGWTRSLGILMFSPSELRGRQRRPEPGVCPTQIPSNPIYIGLTILESNYDKSVDYLFVVNRNKLRAADY